MSTPKSLSVTALAPYVARAKEAAGLLRTAKPSTASIYADLEALAKHRPTPALDLSPLIGAIDGVARAITGRGGELTPAEPAESRTVIDIDFRTAEITSDGSPTTLAARPLNENSNRKMTGHAGYYSDPAKHDRQVYRRTGTGLMLTCIRKPTEGLPWAAPMLSSFAMPAIRQGDTLELEATIPHCPGQVPAWWMVANDWSWPPEIDMLEFFQHPTDGWSNLQTTQITPGAAAYSIGQNDYVQWLEDKAPGKQDDRRTYRYHWGKDTCRLWVDDVLVSERPTLIPDEEMHIILSCGVGLLVGEPPASTPDVQDVMLLHRLKVTR